MQRYFVYILLCADGKYYTGVTNNIERRFAEHQNGIDPDAFTYARRPLQLVYSEEFQWVQQAIAWEKQVKRWSAGKKKALCDRNYDAIHELAKCVNATHHDLRKHDP
ncbi:MAG: GIY-YIG nuclease family protein [Flavobacteriales bacterium]